MNKTVANRSEFDALLEAYDGDIVKLFISTPEDEFKYAGVDFLIMMNHLIKQEPSPKVMVEDMAYLVMLTQHRGTNLGKIQTKSGETLVRKVKLLVSKYDIKAHKKDLPMNNPSLPRLMSLFPEQIYQYRKTKVMEVSGELGGLPQELAWPGGLAMVDPNDAQMIKKFMDWYKSFCAVVKINFDEKNPLIALNNSPVPLTKRYKVKPAVKAPSKPLPALSAPPAPPPAAVTAPAPPSEEEEELSSVSAEAETYLSKMGAGEALTKEQVGEALVLYHVILVSAKWPEDAAKAKCDKIYSSFKDGKIDLALMH